MSVDHLRTPFGNLAADVRTAYNVPWSVAGVGRMGLSDLFHRVYGRGAQLFDRPASGFYSCTIAKRVLTGDDEASIVQSIRSGTFPVPLLGLYLTDLANKGIIPAGQYVIST